MGPKRRKYRCRIKGKKKRETKKKEKQYMYLYYREFLPNFCKDILNKLYYIYSYMYPCYFVLSAYRAFHNFK